MINLSYEITTICSLACPGCQRITKEKYKSDWNKGDLPIDLYIKSLSGLNPNETIINLTGCYGDAIYHKDFFSIIDTTINSGLKWMITTCGANRPNEFWDRLANVDLSKAYWIFSIDGLADTNHIYRKNARWETIDYAVRAISSARKRPRVLEWKYIVFPYNEHQVQEAQELAEEWNIQFTPVKSDRPNSLYMHLTDDEKKNYVWKT